MSFAEVLKELPALTLSQRQMLCCPAERRALDLDEPALSPADEALVEERLAAHRKNPETSVPVGEMKKRLRGVRSVSTGPFNFVSIPQLVRRRAIAPKWHRP
jgi:hypothetical protein